MTTRQSSALPQMSAAVTVSALSRSGSSGSSTPRSSSSSSPHTPRSCPPTIVHPSPVRVCVLGASGTVGSLTVQALLASRVNVRLRAACEAAMLSSEAVQAYIAAEDAETGGGVELLQLDYGDEQQLERLLTGMDRVFVILPWTRGLPAQMAAVLRAASRCGTAFLLKMSSVCSVVETAEQRPVIMQEHAECDALLQASAVPHAIIQSQILLDNLLKFQGDTVKADRAVYGLGVGDSVPYIDARDVADCVVSVLLNPQRFVSRCLVLTGKEAITGEAVAVGMSRVFQTSIAYRAVSEAELRSVLSRQQIPAFMQDDLIGIERMMTEGRLGQLLTPTVKEVCGHPPRTLETFLATYKAQLCPAFSLKQLLHFFL